MPVPDERRKLTLVHQNRQVTDKDCRPESPLTSLLERDAARPTAGSALAGPAPAERLTARSAMPVCRGATTELARTLIARKDAKDSAGRGEGHVAEHFPGSCQGKSSGDPKGNTHRESETNAGRLVHLRLPVMRWAKVLALLLALSRASSARGDVPMEMLLGAAVQQSERTLPSSVIRICLL